MHWVKRPVHTDKYTLRAGLADPTEDSTHYVPGAMVNLYVATTDYDWKYKGFFARAVDAKGRVVGQWGFPGTDHQLFWSPPECGSSHIIHKDAALKPLRAALYFQAPSVRRLQVHHVRQNLIGMLSSESNLVYPNVVQPPSLFDDRPLTFCCMLADVTCTIL